MTACIDPSNGPFRVQRHRVEDRLEDYRRALLFWLHIDDPRITAIVFVDNSGYRLEDLKALVAASNPLNRQVEFISVSSHGDSHQFSYGHAELAMLDKAVSSSPLVSSCSHFIKATGRLQFSGVSRLLDALPSHYLFAVDCRFSGLFDKHQNLYASTQLMLFSANFYQTHVLDSALRLFRPGPVFIENVMFSSLAQCIGVPGAIFRWPVSVQKIGLSGNSHKNYASLSERLKEKIRGVLRRIVPGLWI